MCEELYKVENMKGLKYISSVYTSANDADFYYDYNLRVIPS